MYGSINLYVHNIHMFWADFRSMRYKLFAHGIIKKQSQKKKNYRFFSHIKVIKTWLGFLYRRIWRNLHKNLKYYCLCLYIRNMNMHLLFIFSPDTDTSNNQHAYEKTGWDIFEAINAAYIGRKIVICGTRLAS